jgi:glycosyltransferase involved in cell wall biosynthesis
MNDWILCYEAHDTLGLDPAFFLPEHYNQKNRDYTEKEAKTLAAARNFDLMICNTQTLADDMRAWSCGLLNPQVITLASPLPRLEHAPDIHFGEKITIGYIGTVDKYRGVDILLDSMKYLPNNIRLRIVGRFRIEEGIDPDWLNQYTKDPKLVSRIEVNLVDQIHDVAAEIDKCDIVVQTASHDVIDSRYAAPLKSYGYMMRGKPIVAGNVPSHHELFNTGQSAALYDLDPKSLADCIMTLVNNVDFAGTIAKHAWEQSSYYSFSRKVEVLLTSIKTLSANKHKDIL